MAWGERLCDKGFSVLAGWYVSVSGGPIIKKGAIVAIDLFNPVSSIVVFQYNPDKLSRSIKPRASGGDGGSKAEALRIQGAPEETISLQADLDLTDQLDGIGSSGASMGIYPQLSALEMLVYPKSSWVITNTILMALGTIETIPAISPFTLFVWGSKRVLPVKLSSFSITEMVHDANLNPVRAEVSLELRVLSYSDLEISHPGYHVFLAHQIVKETMAVIGSVGNV
jgi:hypothetical protein